MEFSYFDIIISTIILFLGLKGVLNGFFKELFGLLGIIGGIFVASRVGDTIGQRISDLVFKFESSAAISFTGFLVTLAIFWLFMVTIGFIFKKLSSMSGLGIFDKILGFFFGASKFFFIVAVIAYATYNIKAMRTSIDSVMKNSFMFPILIETGSFIMKLDPVNMSNDINITIDKTIKNSTLSIVENVKEEIKENLEQNASIKEDNK
ncbi:CvpA family protein [Candidatus Sulfurimonas marisnigri]|uniref:CvpA family protein n=1 Tax=Candidatus Sulfurimonas marisnigri TaxID=2740405 RepID=A0A7S7RPU0_9BACT|nr:CvpA family protein [Candidatus Sulfurimonas marisnigri]QOY53863.1 CvpA family protein [Candidatus Sulfurimonas marisnigri]